MQQEYKAPRWAYRVVGFWFGTEQGEKIAESVIGDRFFKIVAKAKADSFVRDQATVGIHAQATVFDSNGQAIYTASI